MSQPDVKNFFLSKRNLSKNTTEKYNFYRMFKSEDLNNDYEAYVKNWEVKIKNKLK